MRYELRQGMANAEVAAYLTKPIKRDDFYSTLSNVLGTTTSQPTPQTAKSPFEVDGLNSALRILIAEDNVVNQKVAHHMLARLGMSADIVSDGLEALQSLERQPYDLVLMDVRMPEMDGIEATRRIQAQRNGNVAPVVVAMTASVTSIEQMACHEAGMAFVLRKPVRAEELVNVLRECNEMLAGNEPQDQSGTPAFNSTAKSPALVTGSLQA